MILCDSEALVKEEAAEPIKPQKYKLGKYDILDFRYISRSFSEKRKGTRLRMSISQ
jgi:hypothetical protein